MPAPRRRRRSAPSRPESPWVREDLGRPGDLAADDAAGTGSGLFGLGHRVTEAELVVVPVPYDATTSYRPGAARGPAAILRASHQVDLFDLDFGRVHEAGLAMLPVPRAIANLSASARRTALPILRRGGPRPGHAADRRRCGQVDAAAERVHRWVREHAGRHLARGALVAVLGGDHSTSFGLLAELAERHPGLGILHVDAHADLRPAYQGFTWSHASIMSEALDRLPGVSRLVQVGVRDVGEGEVRRIAASAGRIRTFFDPDVRRRLHCGATWDETCRDVLEGLPEEVHVSFDVDGLSPELCPHTGTPVPGGLSFAEASHLLRALVESGRRVVGFDLVEVAPGPAGDEWDAAVGARLLYKLAGCALRSQG